MSRKISNKGKIERKMGTGTGKDYVPWILTSELNSIGTTSVIRDWKTGRGVHCLSQAEALWYYILRWDDNNIDIREQYPLEPEKTVQIANEIGVKHPQNDQYVMTTDFLATEANGHYHAYSVKADKNLSKRTLELLCIEKMYWQQKNIEFTMLFKTDVNTVLANNIRLVTEFYDAEKVFDKYSAIKHKISTQKVNFDLGHIIITNEILDQLLLEDKT